MADDTTGVATGWRPTDGDIIVGTVIALDKGWSDQGKVGRFYPIVTLKQDDGTLTNVHCFHAVLERRMLGLAPAIGDKLRITYLGKSRTKDGKREVTNYQVESNRKQDSASFWGSLGGTPPATQSEPVFTQEDFTQAQGSLEDMPEDEDIPF